MYTLITSRTEMKGLFTSSYVSRVVKSFVVQIYVNLFQLCGATMLPKVFSRTLENAVD